MDRSHTEQGSQIIYGIQEEILCLSGRHGQHPVNVKEVEQDRVEGIRRLAQTVDSSNATQSLIRKCAENPVPNDEYSSVIAVTWRLMVHAMMGRSV